MRIIAGKNKGKKINIPNDDKTRPLRDLVKESIFNILEHSKLINYKISNSNVCTYFAGKSLQRVIWCSVRFIF